MRKSLLLLLCLVSSSAFALGNADLVVTSFAADRTTVEAGSPVTVTFRVKNIGTEAAMNYNVNLSNSYSNRLPVLSAASSGGFLCSPIYTNCYNPSVPVGAEGVMTFTVATPPTVRAEPLRIELFGSAINESDSTNNHAELHLTLTAPSRNADLSLSFLPIPNPVPTNTPFDVTYAARNDGPDDLVDVRVALSIFGDQQAPELGGDGWTCVTHSAQAATCARALLAAGQAALIHARDVTPNGPAQLYTTAYVYTAQPHLDPNLANESAGGYIYVGNANDWSRVLVPVTATNLPGANGSLWRTDITGLLDTATLLDPSGCGPIEDPCSPPPVNQMFDVRDEDLLYEQLPTQFIYLARASGNALKISTRVYDASKSGQTAGASIPSPRDDDFSAAGFSLLGIPSSEEFRSTLRIYEYDATQGGMVEVLIYTPYADEPFYRGFHALQTEPQYRATTALLPVRPGYAQLDLSSILLESNQGSNFRVTVRPVGEMKLWGFVSITNNATSHVTVVTP